LSPGDSNATTGLPNVTPTSAARPPPRLCPVISDIRMVICADIPMEQTCQPDCGIGVHVGDIVVQILRNVGLSVVSDVTSRNTHSSDRVKQRFFS
jgi:hypothetical protein